MRDHLNAGAGQAARRAPGPTPSPRVGGETYADDAECCAPPASGVHPRVGGETGMRSSRTPEGPSPRGRGNPLPREEAALRRVHPRVGGETTRSSRPGSIPAWAGKPSGWSRGSEREVHPRVGGETVECPEHERCRPARSGSIPAWAGKPTSSCRLASAKGLRGRNRASLGGPSPRGRGNHYAVDDRQSRSIAAWAGKPSAVQPVQKPRRGPSPRGRGNRSAAGAARCPRVHPRVGGETAGHTEMNVPQPRIRVHPRVGGETPSDEWSSD